MTGVIAFFKDRKRNIAVRLSKLEQLLVLGRLIGSFRCSQFLELDNRGQMAGIAFENNRHEASTDKPFSFWPDKPQGLGGVGSFLKSFW